MDLDVRMKAVLLGACMLIDFNFFEKKGNQENDQIGMFSQIDWFDHTNTLVEAADYQVDQMVFPNDRLFESISTMHFIPR